MHDRLRRLVDSRDVSMNKLIDEPATIDLAQHDAEVSFRTLSGTVPAKRGLQLVVRLDRHFKRR